MAVERKGRRGHAKQWQYREGYTVVGSTIQTSQKGVNSSSLRSRRRWRPYLACLHHCYCLHPSRVSVPAVAAQASSGVLGAAPAVSRFSSVPHTIENGP